MLARFDTIRTPIIAVLAKHGKQELLADMSGDISFLPSLIAVCLYSLLYKT